ncbi:hypothetical protein [Pontimicrobium sp. MEBiC01747]
MERQTSKQKAIDIALWRNVNHRYNNNYGVVHSTSDDYIIIPTDHPTFENADFETLPQDYSDISYKQIQHIAMDINPLMHWEDLKGVFSTMHGELLRFLLHYKVPLEKFMRWELACREYDNNFQQVSFEEAKKTWLV